ncbi:MAG: DEAD/DEAH box helicase, partial [Actinomycetia bacterium]|nr:DEAD/DEAH box helicase [Actinomycetes bacterium]
AMRAHPRAGIAALAGAAGVATDAITAERVAFALAPRLNAAGRMADPALSLELLLTSDVVRAEELARALDEHNRLRQAAESDLMEEAIAQAEKTYHTGDAALVVAGEGWHEGVRGIVASRLVERYGVPSIVFCVEEGVAQGSGRSVPGVDLYRALESVSARLLRFGGHPQAVGLALPAEDLPWFRATLLDRLSQDAAGLPAPVLAIDAEVELSDLGVELAAELDTLEPFGHNNPRPLLATRGVFLNGRRAVGKTGAHLAFTAYDGVASVPGIMFRCVRIDDLLSYEATADVAFEFDVDQWQGSARPRLVARDIVTHTAPAQAPASQLVHDLFEHAEKIVAQGEYATIGEEESFHTKLVGVTFEGRQDVVAGLETGTPLRLVRERENEHDPNACALRDPRGAQVGFFNRRLAAVIAPLIDQGVEYDVTVANVTQSPDERTRGVNVLVTRRDLAGDRTCVEPARERRAELSELDGPALAGALREHLLGQHAPHPAQTEALESLAAGTSTLVVMATGRGKSYIFHHHAARLAIASDRASVFVYPLRALVADQAFHLQDTFAGIGCTVKTVTGETSAPERDEAFSALGEGTLDVVLTTPEFLEHHAARFAATGRVSFVVIDEAHHVGLSRAAHRPTYGRLGRALETLGHPVVLAVTATADTAVEAQIREVLGIERTVVDPTVRENLVLDDRRGTRDKEAFVASLVARGDKTIVYVNSRQRAVSLARVLHERVAATHDAVAFYTAGLSRTARHAIEAAFREGAIKTVVATSAFGEGVNVPDVRHVILYHMPFSAVEFNQMSGRAGRDGGLAKVHLLYGEADARINRSILRSLAPERDDIAAVYLALKECATEAGGSVEVTNSELAERLKKFRPTSSLDEKGVSVAIGILRELGLLDAEGTGSWRRLSLLPAPQVKLDLATSVRYAEGHEEVALFEEFAQWALTASADDLLHTFDRPILPRHASA